MKIKSGYLLREVAGSNLVVPVEDKRIAFNGVITLNNTGAFLWKALTDKDLSEDELADILLEEYDVDEYTARKDVADFVQKLKNKDILD